MSINATEQLQQQFAVLQKNELPTTGKVQNSSRGDFLKRLEQILNLSQGGGEGAVEAAQNSATLLQLAAVRNSLELLSDDAGSKGGIFPDIAVAGGVAELQSAVSAYLANLAEGEKGATGSQLAAGEKLIEKVENRQPAGQPVRRSAERLNNAAPLHIEESIAKASERYGVDHGLIRAVIKAESNFNPRAVSHAGAQGLMQLMPATARGLGVTDPFDPEQNIMGGTRFLKSLLERYNGNLDAALAAYNWGPGNVDKRPEKLPRETRDYLVKVKQHYADFSA